LSVENFGKQISFFFNAHNHLLEEVAKFRAARRMWANIMQSRFGANSPQACMLRFHAQTAGSTLQAQQPLVNTSRVTLQALSAVLGGCQSLHANGYDEALSLPSEGAATLALRTQQVLAYESGVTDTVDPLGGSYAIEALTDRLEAQAKTIMDKIDSLGGMPAAIAQGYPQREIQNTAYRTQLHIEAGRQVIVGINRFQDHPGHASAHNPVAQNQGQAQIERLQAFRKRRDANKARLACDAVRNAARGDGNIMSAIVEAVRSEATLGEISDALRQVFGEHTATSYL